MIGLPHLLIYVYILKPSNAEERVALIINLEAGRERAAGGVEDCPTSALFSIIVCFAQKVEIFQML